MIEFYHQTSIPFAKKIILSQIFESHNSPEDHGLNGFNDQTWHGNKHTLDCAREATIKFTWGDPSGCEITPFKDVDFYYPVCEMESDTLYRQGNFRLFIRAPYKGRLLRLVDVKFNNENDFLSSFEYPSWIDWIPFERARKNLREKHRIIKRDHFLRIFADKGLLIEII